MTRTNDFTPATKRKARERSGGTCEVHRISKELRKVWYSALPLECNRKGEEVDHIIPETNGGSRDLSNAAYLCKLCHAIKTVVDNKMAKKANRLQGLTGQSKRRAENGSQIQSRGFDKRFKRKMNGQVVPT
ncbi:MAG: HNH endonuclease signature motif containing protein [Pseudomonadota bacterium]